MTKWIGGALLTLFALNVTVTVNAELLYQPPPGGALDARWREGSSALLEGIARIFDGLAAIESKRSVIANRHFDDAFRQLGRSSEIYSGLVNSIRSPRKISIERLNPDRQKLILNAFSASQAPLLVDEADAAKLAAAEVRRLLAVFEKERSAVSKANIAAVQRLFSELNRLQRLGTYTAELMTTLR
ncbi:MAG: hypothetical protein ACXW6V_22615 [Candidatus Binatia bacterium]